VKVKKRIFIIFFLVLIGLSISTSMAVNYSGQTSAMDRQQDITFKYEGDLDKIPPTIGGLSTGNIPVYNSSSNSSKNNEVLKADLKISKIAKNGNTHRVYIKNVGKKTAGKSYLGIYDGKTLVKRVTVKSIGIGKTIEVKVSLAQKYKNKIKTFKADYTNVVKESNEKNNIFKSK